MKLSEMERNVIIRAVDKQAQDFFITSKDRRNSPAARASRDRLHKRFDAISSHLKQGGGIDRGVDHE